VKNALLKMPKHIFFIENEEVNNSAIKRSSRVKRN
jgi:hypothetical protein